MKSCQNCYYCNDSIQLASNWWCSCSNQGRSVETQQKNQSWGKNRLNLTCWRADAPSGNIQKNPDFSELIVIRPTRKLKRNSRLRRFSPKKEVTIPWSYVIRSKIVSVLRREESSH